MNSESLSEQRESLLQNSEIQSTNQINKRSLYRNTLSIRENLFTEVEQPIKKSQTSLSDSNDMQFDTDFQSKESVQQNASLLKDRRPTYQLVKKGTKEDLKEGGHVYSQESLSENLMKAQVELVEEYQRENERIIPADSSRIIYHALHPLQTAIIDMFKDLDDKKKKFDAKNNKGDTIEVDATGLDGPSKIEEESSVYKDHADFDANAFEFLVMFEEVIFAKEYVKNSKSDQKVDNSMNGQNDTNNKVAAKNIQRKQSAQLEKNQQDPRILQLNDNYYIEDYADEERKQIQTSINNDDQELINEFAKDDEVEPPIKYSIQTDQKNYKKERQIDCSYQHYFFDEKRKKNSDPSSPEITNTKYCKQYILSMWRIDRFQETKIIVAQQIITINNENVTIFKDKLFFSSDSKNIFFILMNKYDKQFIEVVSFNSQNLMFMPELSFEENNLDFLKQDSANFQDPVMFNLTDEEKNNNNYSLYIQDQNMGYFIYQEPEKSCKISLKVNDDSGLNEFEENSVQLKIINIFFWLDTDNAIILMKYLSPKITKKQQNFLFQIKIIKFSKFIDRTDCLLKKFDCYIPKNEEIEINSENFWDSNQIKSFYHRKTGIIIKTDRIFIKQEQNFPKENIPNYETILFISSTNLKDSSANKQDQVLKYFETQDLQFPLNPQIQAEFYFKLRFSEADYIIQLKDYIDQKFSIEECINQKLALQVPNSQNTTKYDGNKSFKQFQDFVTIKGKNNSMSTFEVDMDTSNYPMRPRVIFYDNFDGADQQSLEQVLHEKIKIEKQCCQYNEPYIISVEDQIRINVYSTLFQKKINTNSIDLKHHFEFFLEVPAGDVKIDDQIYFRHQICMMVTYNILNYRHQIEVLIMPSFDKMEIAGQNDFEIKTLYKSLDLKIGLPQILLKENIIFAQFIQIFKEKRQGQEKELEKDILLLQTKDRVKTYHIQQNQFRQKKSQSMIQEEIQEKDKNVVTQRGNAFTNQDRFIIFQTNAKELWDHLEKENNYDGYDANESQNSILYYAIRKSEQNQGDMELILINFNQQGKIPIKFYPLYTFQTKIRQQQLHNQQQSLNQFLKIQLSQEDPKGLTILILQRNFVMKKLYLDPQQEYQGKFIFKSSMIDIIDKSKKVWNESEIQKEIIINDHGIFLENYYYQYFDNNTPELRLKDMKHFEKHRFKQASETFQVEQAFNINQNHKITQSSPDKLKILMQFDHQKSQNSSNQQYFVVFPLLDSKLKSLIPIDSFAQEHIELSTYIGNQDNDVLIKIRGGQFIVFFKNFGMQNVEVKEEDAQKLNSNLNSPDVLQQATSNQKEEEDNFSDYQIRDMVVGLPDSEFKLKILLTKENKYAVLTVTKNGNKRYDFKKSRYIDIFDKKLYETEQKSISNQNIISILKLTPDGEVAKLHFNENVLYELNGTQVQAKKENITILFLLDETRQKRIEDELKNKIKSQIEDTNFDLKQQEEDFQDQEDIRRFSQMVKIAKKNEEYVELDGKNINGQKNSKEAKDEESNPVKKAVILKYINFLKNDFDFCFLQKYQNKSQFFVFKFKTTMYFFKNDFSQNNLVNLNLEKFKDLKLNQNGNIYQILPVKSKQHVQFLYHDRGTNNFHMFVWNLGQTQTQSTNQEEQMQIFRPTKQDPISLLVKGTNLKQNYLFFKGQNTYMDLRSDLPQNFLSGKLFWQTSFDLDQLDPDPQNKYYYKYLKSVYNDYKNELKICSQDSHCIGFQGVARTQIQRSYSFIDLQYVQYLKKQFFDKKYLEEEERQIDFDKISIMFPNYCNILHFMALNQLFLQTYLNQIQEKLEKDEDDELHILNYVYYPFCPNTLPMKTTQGKGRRPFSLALRSNQSHCFDIILEILMTDSQRSYIMHIKKYLIDLMEMRGDTVHNFLLEKCEKKLFSKKIKVSKNKPKTNSCQNLFTQTKTDKQIIQSVTQYTNDTQKFYLLQENTEDTNSKQSLQQNSAQQVQAIKDKKNEVLKIIEQENDEQLSDNEIEIKLVVEGDKNDNQFEKRQSHFKAFDFEDQLIGFNANKLLTFLTYQSNNIRVFELNHIQTLLQYQWENIKSRYQVVLGLYIVKIFLMIFYVVIYDRIINCTPSVSENIEKEHQCSYSIVLKLQKHFLNLDLIIWALQGLLLIIQAAITLYEFIILLRIRSYSSYAVFIFNLINLFKLGFDQYFLLEFQQKSLMYNLQADLTLEYRNNVDRRYKDRYAMYYIMIIRAGNALMFISLPLIFFYKIRFYPRVSQYVPRFFLALKAILQIILIFMGIFSFLYYAYSILEDMKYNLGNTEKELPQGKQTDEIMDIFEFVRWMDYSNLVYRHVSLVVIIAISTLFFQYIGSSMTKADSQASKELELQRYLNMAQLMNENSFLIDSNKKYKETRYVIVSHREKSRKIGDRRTQEVDSGKQQEIQTETNGGTDAHAKNKEAAVEEQIKDLTNTIHEMKAMIQAMAKKQQ